MQASCSHAGIVNVVKDAVSVFQRPIYMVRLFTNFHFRGSWRSFLIVVKVIGGLHLAGPEFGPRIPMTVNFLSEKLRPAPAYILPMHCSGFQAKLALEKAFGEGCIPAGVGIKFDIDGDRQADKLIFPPSY